MADSAELAFVKAQVNTLGSLPLQYPNDYQQSPHNSLKKVPVLPVDIPSPPVRKAPAEATSTGTVKITFKSLKPPRTFTLPSVNTTDSIATVKSQLAAQPGAPPADALRLLLRGKALADGKLLKEYDVKDGAIVNLMLKPGFEWNWDTTASAVQANDADRDVGPEPSSKKTKLGHGRIPSVILSPSPSATTPIEEHPASIALTLDTSRIPASDGLENDGYHRKIADPEFWQRLHAFLGAEFETTDDASHAFESFLLGSKGALSANEIAKIRDNVGVIGMAGT